jgi:FSR family fosmidomycin resistance protein-like MFS transporter
MQLVNHATSGRITCVIFLLIEFLDELVFGLQDAAWPLIRADLHLTYIQIGILLSVPGIISNIIEPFIFILGDIWKRRVIILIGGILFTLALILTATSKNFIWLLLAIILFHPSSGAFVSLSQATLIDADETRHEQNMARWTFAGSLGIFIGPLLLGGLIGLGFGWQTGFWALASFSTVILLTAFMQIPNNKQSPVSPPKFTDILDQFRITISELHNGTVLRWLILLEFSNLMLDVLYGFLALYFVDVAGVTPAIAAFAVAIWTGVGLLGDFLLIPLVERIKGLDYLRVSVVLELILFPAFLLTKIFWLKLILLGLLGFFNSGWYAILKANLFSSMPGKSGSVLALDNVSGLIGKLIPFGIGLAAQTFGLGTAIWLLLAGPIALLIGLPRAKNTVNR